jgi:hypothetical protein
VDTSKGAKMREECSMSKRQSKRARRSFTAEFKAEAVRLCKVGDRTIEFELKARVAAFAA